MEQEQNEKQEIADQIKAADAEGGFDPSTSENLELLRKAHESVTGEPFTES